jgi:L-alanine-DL-glutamate epimerase-like enolase superfamily enzyme
MGAPAATKMSIAEWLAPQRGDTGEDATPRVVSVAAIPISIPLATPVRFSTREVASREYLLVYLEAEDGVRGVGYTYTGRGAARAVSALIEDDIAPILIGRSSLGPERWWRALYQETLLAGRRGLALRAVSAIDIALWDLLGKRAQQPLSVLLGGHSGEVPAYASGGYYRPGDPNDNIERELSQYASLGFTDFKIKVGGAPFDVDVQRVRTARRLIGPTGRLALDANNAWRYPRDAIRFIRAVEEYDPWWIEEPLSPDDVRGHAEIRRWSLVPVATGEIHATRWDFRDLILANAADILQPDAAVLGGVSEWMKVAHAASAFGVPVAPHWNADIHVHLAGAVDNCLAVEYFLLEQDIYNFERILNDRLTTRDGKIRIPDRPGLGLNLDEEAVENYRLR